MIGEVRFFRVPKESMPPLVATLKGRIAAGRLSRLELELTGSVVDVHKARDEAIAELDRYFAVLRKSERADSASGSVKAKFWARVLADRTVELAYEVQGAGADDLRSQTPFDVASALRGGVRHALGR